MSEKLNKNNNRNEENVRTVNYIKIYSLRLVSLLDLKPHDLVFSLDPDKLAELHNSVHLEATYKISDYPNFSFIYKEGTPFQWYLEPIKDFTEKGMAGIIENWITESDLEQLKSKTYFI